VGVERAAGIEHCEEKDGERPAGDDGGIELAQRPRGGVARIGERVLAAFDALAVQLLEAVPRHVHLAANRQELGVVATQPLWHGGDRPHLRGDVVAALAVAPRHRAVVDTVLVDDFDREAVELRFTAVADRAVVARVGEPAANPVVELADRLGLAALVQRAHRCDVLDRVKFVNRCPADALSWTVRRRQVECRLQVFEPREEGVVGAVADDRVVLDVVAVVVVVDRLPQRRGLLARRRLAQ
jgi:hypothetical protein